MDDSGFFTSWATDAATSPSIRSRSCSARSESSRSSARRAAVSRRRARAPATWRIRSCTESSSAMS